MTSPACWSWGVAARTVDDHELRPRHAGHQLLLAAHGDPNFHFVQNPRRDLSHLS
jgi:hypothetical protein